MSQRLTRKRLIDIGNRVLEHQWAAILQIAEDENLDEGTVIRALNMVMFVDALKERRSRVATAAREVSETADDTLGQEDLPPQEPRKRGSKKTKDKKGGGT